MSRLYVTGAAKVDEDSGFRRPFPGWDACSCHGLDGS